MTVQSPSSHARTVSLPTICRFATYSGPRNLLSCSLLGIAEGGPDRLLPRGALVRYREWYGAFGPNVGLKMTAEANARAGLL